MRKSFKVPMFDQPIVFTNDMEEARKASKPKTDCEHQWFDDCVEESAGFTLITDEGKIVVCAEEMDTVVHELAHASFYILLSLGGSSWILIIMKPFVTYRGIFSKNG